MKKITSKCCYPGCSAAVGASHVACFDHWITVPASVQSDVAARLYGWRSKSAALEFLVNHFKAAIKAAA